MFKRKKFSENNKGFTLVELLIVISVIGVLAGIILTVVDPNSIRSRARDSQRVSDLGKIQNALELYYQDNRAYPESANWVTFGQTGETLTGTLSPAYINDFPQDPNFASGVSGSPCSLITASQFGYSYITNSGGQAYVLSSAMENEASAEPSLCSGLNNWGTLNCAFSGTDGNFCYGVENP